MQLRAVFRKLFKFKNSHVRFFTVSRFGYLSGVLLSLSDDTVNLSHVKDSFVRDELTFLVHVPSDK